MKAPLTTLIAVILAMSPAGATESEDAAAKIKAFEEKALKAPMQNSSPERTMRLRAQFQMLRTGIMRNDDESFRMMQQAAQLYDLPPELQEEWLKIVETISNEMEKRREKASEKWREQVDQLVEDARAAVLKAKASDDLDPVLVKAGTLEAPQRNRQNALDERSRYKLEGTLRTLQAWAKYLDFRDAGNVKGANSILDSLMNNSSEFPLLPLAEIRSHRKPDPVNPSINELTEKIFEGVTSPEDLPKALARVDDLLKNSGVTAPHAYQLRSNKEKIERLEARWKLIGTSMSPADFRKLGTVRFTTEDPLHALGEQINTLLVMDVLKGSSGVAARADENPQEYMTRILDGLKDKEDYAGMIEVLSTYQRTGQEIPPAWAIGRTALDRFVAGKRFDEAGDVYAAVTSYRMVLNTSGKSPYAPVEAAQAALKRIGETHPDALKNSDSMILEEIQELKRQIQLLMRRVGTGMQGGRPMFPN